MQFSRILWYFVLGPNILFGTLFSDTLSLCYHFRDSERGRRHFVHIQNNE